MLKYDPQGYTNLIRMSNTKHLLVEGPDDKRLFKLLLDELYQLKIQDLSKSTIKLVIDSAEELINFGNILGNCQKVEEICQIINNKPYCNKLVGFTDREFREFGISNTIQDNLNLHKVQGRLVWSRGHSIENYFFDFSILREPLRDLSATEYFDDVLDIFQNFIESALRLACTASLTGKEIGNLDLIKSSINWRVIKVEINHSKEVVLLLNDWAQSLVRIQKLSVEKAEKIIERYKYWYQIVEKADFQVIRWMCHGHIGIAVIWAVYSRCIHDMCSQNGLGNPEAEVAKVEGIKRQIRTHTCASWWARKALANHCDYPTDVFQLLELI